VRTPWPVFLAWKQLFPSQKKVSFFSLLAVVGVALGVNVMIVVVAFMKGFQHKFREDIVDAQGHARAISLSRSTAWRELQSELLEKPEILAASPYLNGPLLAQKNDSYSIPFAIGIDLSSGEPALPFDQFLQKGQSRLSAHEAIDVTPSPSLDYLDDEVVFLSSYVANRLGVRPGAILYMHGDSTMGDGDLAVQVKRLGPRVPSAEWKLSYLDQDFWLLESQGLSFSKKLKVKGGLLDAGPGTPTFELVEEPSNLKVGDVYTFQSFRSSTLEIYSPAIVQKAQANEMIPPKEVRVGGILEVPWQGFHAEAMVGTFRLIEELQMGRNRCDGMYLKFSSEIARNEKDLADFCEELELPRSVHWAFVPWFVENAWFFDLLKFEEYLMILIMVPIGLVAAFAIAIALMTSVLRKIREIGLLVAMGGVRVSVGAIFCMQGFFIGLLGALLGCLLALLFIRFRDSIMTFIVVRIAGDEGRAGVAQFYDFYSLSVPYPWESGESAALFFTFGLFAILVSTIAGLIPAWRASRMNTADALRNE